MFADGFFALSRHRDVDAGSGGFRRRNHGRAHSQPDARARARLSMPHGGRSGSRGKDAADDGDTYPRSGFRPPGHRPDGGAQSESHGAYGHVSGRRHSPDLSGISSALRRSLVGGLLSAFGRNFAPPAARTRFSGSGFQERGGMKRETSRGKS